MARRRSFAPFVRALCSTSLPPSPLHDFLSFVRALTCLPLHSTEFNCDITADRTFSSRGKQLGKPPKINRSAMLVFLGSGAPLCVSVCVLDCSGGPRWGWARLSPCRTLTHLPGPEATKQEAAVRPTTRGEQKQRTAQFDRGTQRRQCHRARRAAQLGNTTAGEELELVRSGGPFSQRPHAGNHVARVAAPSPTRSHPALCRL